MYCACTTHKSVNVFLQFTIYFDTVNSLKYRARYLKTNLNAGDCSQSEKFKLKIALIKGPY